MKKTILFCFIILISTQTHAQLIKNRSIDVSIGYGISAPFDDMDVTGEGFYLQGEYVFGFSKWFDLRPYAGLILTGSDDDSIFRSEANAFLFGGKTRITAPIPWVSPYVEIGIGGSIGSFETVTFNDNIDDSGLFFHIPFSIGLELGSKHNFDIAFTYYFHNSVEQFSGAAAFGISIPLNK